MTCTPVLATCCTKYQYFTAVSFCGYAAVVDSAEISYPPSSLGAWALTASRIILRDCSPLMVVLPRLLPPPSTADTPASVDVAAYGVDDGLLVEARP